MRGSGPRRKSAIGVVQADLMSTCDNGSGGGESAGWPRPGRRFGVVAG
jgi:hypothetical protein